jgi:nicotinate-nucleotide adenylyltransferase
VGPSTTAPRIGVYPGSFDPPTIAHVHIAERAIEHFGLERVDFAISTMTLGKDDSRLSPISERVDELVAISEGNPALGVRTTHDSLLADIAAGYDLVILGADKWHQVLDPVWYGSVEARDEALRRLPVVALAPRPPHPVPGEDPRADPPPGVEVVVLDTDPDHHPVSATGVRDGRHEWRARPANDR